MSVCGGVFVDFWWVFVGLVVVGEEYDQAWLGLWWPVGDVVEGGESETCS